jgi:hypothetical protein
MTKKTKIPKKPPDAPTPYASITELPASVQSRLPPFAQDGWLQMFNNATADGYTQRRAARAAWQYFIRGDYGEFLHFPTGRDSAGKLHWRLRCIYCQIETESSDAVLAAFPHDLACDIIKVKDGALDPSDITNLWS